MESFKRFGSSILDLIYPPVCMHCSGVTGAADVLCAKCWMKMRPITHPLCPVLGLPFEYFLGKGAISAEAIANPPIFDRARSALVHNEVARTLISRLKFGDREEMATFCARMMVFAGSELFGDNADPLVKKDRPVLVPVPLHPGRQWQRRYNQSTLLARAIARQAGLKIEPLLVRRVKPTRPQIGLSARQREKNVNGAFAVVPQLLEKLQGKRVVIVDDVITTGSTVNAISAELKKNGVERIDVISFSRVVIGIDDEEI
ncbi:MAG: ComF family protein [Devosiaceae bacterium]|nr:ComF family protein [Devosiaceae bacterium]